MDIGQDRAGESIIKTIISLAHNLELTVIAEGVEVEEQIDFLTYEGCDVLQGFGLSRPLDKEAATKLLERNNSEMCFELMKKNLSLTNLQLKN